jgi:hydroxymethylpyrimidine kinase/phosphomethylpyrimidine kinase/thiamine-phosphate diphosphorylase
MTKRIVWTIAGSDSSGGAGIQADLKTFNGLGVYGASVITAITAQNTLGVERIEPVHLETIKSQLDSLKEDMPPQAVKLGMLYSSKCVEVVASALDGIRADVVCDPVMVATSGDQLYEPTFLETLKDRLLPLVDLLTPNLQEAHLLLNKSTESFLGLRDEQERDDYVEDLAPKLLALGPKSVLIKRGDDLGEYSQDYWTDGKNRAWLSSLRQITRNTHGTGCTLASAVAACFALGYSELDALAIAKAYVNQGLRMAPGLGKGRGPLAHLGWPENQDDIPFLTKTAEQARNRLSFPDCGSEPLGFYPIVDSSLRVEKLIRLGVKTIQLRIKNTTGSVAEKEIIESIRLANEYKCRLFINDYWEIALEHKAYGVHLGQEDLETADLPSLMEAGLRLGVSTHGYAEVARALALHPSYIAIGPIHATTSKQVNVTPQGVSALRRWRRTLRCPLVAIGGITLQNAREVLDTGVDGIAVMKDLASYADSEAQVKSWLVIFESQKASYSMSSRHSRSSC